MKNILFLCTGNSCRSQMAEGWANKLLSPKVKAYSAGILAQGVNPYAIKVMQEAGVDISHHISKTVKQVLGVDFDLVVTVCDNASQNCPVFPKKVKVIHQNFDDPPKLAINCSTHEEKLEIYRRVCTQIKEFVQELQ